MSREYGQLRHDIWSDDDWRSLTVPAQHLYMLLLSDPKLSYCGVTGWHPGKISQRSGENAGRDTLVAGAELSNRRFVVIDEETEEVLVRSYLKHDPVMKNPRLAVTMTKDYAVVGSKKIRAAIVFELTRLKSAEPDWPCWENPHVKTVLRQTAVSAFDMDPDLPMGAGQYLGVGYPSSYPSSYPSDYPNGYPNDQPSGTGKPLGAVTPGPTTATATGTSTGTRSNDLAAAEEASSAQGAGLRAVRYAS